jgi:hypothetical protein
VPELDPASVRGLDDGQVSLFETMRGVAVPAALAERDVAHG